MLYSVRSEFRVCLQSRITPGIEADMTVPRELFFALLITLFHIHFGLFNCGESHVCPCLSDTGEIHDVKRLPTALKNEELNLT